MTVFVIVSSAVQQDSPNSKPSKGVSNTEWDNSMVLNSLKNPQESYKEKPKVKATLLQSSLYKNLL